MTHNWPLAAFSLLLVAALTLILQLIGALITFSKKLLRGGMSRVRAKGGLKGLAAKLTH
jgi:hypothetical protein